VAIDVLPYLTREQREMVWWLEETRRQRQAYFQTCAFALLQLVDVDPMFLNYAKRNLELADEEAAR
jgi:hypothetical protein